MSSGMSVDPEVLTYFESIRTHRAGEDPLDHHKLILFKIDKNIHVDKDHVYTVRDLAGEKNIFKKVVSIMPPKQSRYALYDCSYTTSETSKKELVFIMWAPAECSLKDKMLYASSKEAIRKKFTGLKCDWQVNDESDQDVSTFLTKLSPKGNVLSLEGVDLCGASGGDGLGQ